MKKQKIFILSAFLVLIGGMLGAFLMVRHTPTQVRAAGVTTIFQDNFDTYAPGPLPTGTGTNQWTAVNVKGTGFALAVSKVQAASAPNSLQFTMGSSAKGHAWALKNYAGGTGYATHTVDFKVYIDSTLTLSGQPISLFTAENHSQPTNGSAAVFLSASHHLQVVRYDSTGKKHVTTTTSVLATGQWYSIELDQTNAAVNGSWSLWLNGTQIAGETGVDAGNTLVTAIIAGDTLTSAPGMSGLFYEDDVVTSTTSVTPPPAIFQDNFDTYAPGPLPTGTGTNQWTAVNVKGTGFALAVSNAQAASAPNSLQFTMGSGTPGHAWALKKYAGTGYTTHAIHFLLYLDASLTLSGQTISLFTAENHSQPTNGSAAVFLSASHHLQVVRYDSTGKKHVTTTTSVLATGQWYSIELDQTNAAVNGSWSLWLNGTQIAGETGVDAGNTLVTAIIAGDTQNSVNAMAGSFYEDNVLTAAHHIG